MKIVILNDSHFGCRNENAHIMRNTLEFYEEQLFPYLKKNKIKTIIHVGDLFDKRKALSTYSTQIFKRRILDKLKHIDFHWIIGNHDTAFVNTNLYNTSVFLSEYTNIKVYESTTDVKIDNRNFIFIPWITSENYQDTMNKIEKSNSGIVFGHLEMEGFEFYTGSVCKHGLKASVFNKFQNVYSGHFHKKSKIGNITYLGTQYQMTWQEVYDIKGFHVFDTETSEIEFIQNSNNLFIEIRENDNVDNMNLEGKFVRVVVSEQNVKSSEYEKIENKMRDKKVADLSNKIIDKIAVNEDVEITDESVDILDIPTISSQYIDKIENFEYKNELKNFINEIYKDALSAQN